MMVCADRIIAPAACLQQSPSTSATDDKNEESVAVSVNGGEVTKDEILNVKSGGEVSLPSSKGKWSASECRICQEEDDDKHLESPCACSGTLKFAHRKCIQRWCNKKGDITCEICSQVFSPNYICPPPRGNDDVLTIDIRQAWEAHIDLQHPPLLAFTEAEHRLLRYNYDYGMENSRTLTCFRYVAIILMLLLLIHQTFMVKLDTGMSQESSIFFNVRINGYFFFSSNFCIRSFQHYTTGFRFKSILLQVALTLFIFIFFIFLNQYQISILQLAGFLLPCYVAARSWYIVQCRRRRQGMN